MRTRRLPRTASIRGMVITTCCGSSRALSVPDSVAAALEMYWPGMVAIRRSLMPMPENVNALPEPVRRYVHALETISDPAGLVHENALLKEQIAALTKKGSDPNER